MENLFSTLGYLIFGKRWILWNMRHGYKATIWLKKTEVEYNRQRVKESRSALRKAEADASLAQKEYDERPNDCTKEKREHLKANLDEANKLKMSIGKEHEVVKKQYQDSNDNALNAIKKYEFIKNYKAETWN